MEFRHISPDQLDKMHFRLPGDHPANAGVLPGKRSEVTPRIFVGCAKWGVKKWIGKIYPVGIKAAEYLLSYSRQFNSIELDAISYGRQNKEDVVRWKNSVDKNFIFCPKFSKVITRCRLMGVSDETMAFLDVISEFGKNLGPVFLLLPRDFTPEENKNLVEFLSGIPGEFRVFTSVRHPDWFNADHLSLFETLKKGLVITDNPARPFALHMRLTTPVAFIRFSGNAPHKSDYIRIDQWAERISEWINQGLKECYFFVHQHDDQYSPEICAYFIERLNVNAGLNLSAPRFLDELKLF
jgi:uncharacterized protein YecE (DUF72 family)